ncbi:hypothetical protein [Nonomuraea phyllanthi]|uniref:hypothetical protein n=1 Tax=Nonomuraea phyllanthi TaxID=2219224 RepID=UPI001884F816|nr:hypothetical protein [Nonomuraea phyllanthi]
MSQRKAKRRRAAQRLEQAKLQEQHKRVVRRFWFGSAVVMAMVVGAIGALVLTSTSTPTQAIPVATASPTASVSPSAGPSASASAKATASAGPSLKATKSGG